MKICRITSVFPPPWEGLSPGPYELSLAQAKIGHHITIIAKYTPGCETLDKETPFKICRIKAKRDLMFSFLSTIKFICLHLKERYDIVHNHGASATALLLLKRLFFIKVPVVTSVHIIRKAQYKAIQKADIYKVPREILGKEVNNMIPVVKIDRKELLLEKIYLKLSDNLAVVSEQLKKDIKNEYGLSDDVFVIFNGVNLAIFNNKNNDKESLRKRLPVNCKHLILFVGVLNGRKGEFDLIKAMQKVFSVYPDANLLIIGNGPTKEIAFKMVKKLNLEDNITFIPNVKYDEMSKYYRASDLFVLPSYSEGLPKVLLEAMACGTPVIASDIPAHREILKDNVTGYLFKTGDVDDLASTIVRALENVEQRKMISSNARTLVEREYSWEAVAERLNHVYGINT